MRTILGGLYSYCGDFGLWFRKTEGPFPRGALESLLSVQDRRALITSASSAFASCLQSWSASLSSAGHNLPDAHPGLVLAEPLAHRHPGLPPQPQGLVLLHPQGGITLKLIEEGNYL